MSNEVLVIIIAVIIMVPAILFYELVIVRNYADKFLPPTILSLFSNGRPRKLDKKKQENTMPGKKGMKQKPLLQGQI